MSFWRNKSLKLMKLILSSRPSAFEKTIALQDHSRRPNLLVYAADETELQLSTIISDMLANRLGVLSTSITGLRRLGKAAGKRPVTICFQNFTEKRVILRNTTLRFLSI